MRRIVATPLVVAALATAACGSSGSSAAKSTTTSTTSAQASAALTTDRSLASAANLSLSDFPAGWTSQPASSSKVTSGQYGAQLASCLGTTPAQLGENDPATVESPDFSDSNNDTASSQVTYNSSDSQVSAAFSLLKSSRLPSCISHVVNEVVSYEVDHPSNPSDTLPSGATVGNATFSQMSFPSYGDESLAFQLAIPITVSPLNITVYDDAVFVQKGRAAVEMTFTSTVSPFDPTMAEQLTSAVVGRLSGT